MKKVQNRFLSAIIIGIVAVMYSILVFVIKDMDRAGKNFWGGYIFTMVAFAITAGVLCFTKISHSKTIATQLPLMTAAGAYLIITLLVNIIFLCLDKDSNATAMIVINVLLLLAFIIYFIVMYMFSRGASEASQRVTEVKQTANMMEISVASLIMLAKDESVKKALEQLKERVKYGERIHPGARPEVQSAHQQVNTQIEVVRTLLMSGADSSTVLSAVEQCKSLLLIRDEMISKLR